MAMSPDVDVDVSLPKVLHLYLEAEVTLTPIRHVVHLIEIGRDEDGLDGDFMNSCSRKMSSRVGSTSQRFLEQQSWKM